MLSRAEPARKLEGKINMGNSRQGQWQDKTAMSGVWTGPEGAWHEDRHVKEIGWCEDPPIDRVAKP